MTTSLYMPDVKVEVAFGAGYATAAASRTWTDVSAYVELHDNIEIVVGRQDERSEASPNQLTLTLDNSDGRFTPGNTSGAYYPNVKVGVPIRVLVTPPGGVESVRFLGYVDEWPTEWEQTGYYAKATIQAHSRLARLGIAYPLLDLVTTSYLASRPDYYWRMDDAAGASDAAEFMDPTRPAMRGVEWNGQDLTFGTAIGPGTDGLTALQWGTASIGGVTSYLEAQVEAPTSMLSVELFTASTANGIDPIWTLRDIPGVGTPGSSVELAGMSGDYVAVYVDGVGKSWLAVTGSGDGETHHMALVLYESGADLVAEFWMDGVSYGTNTWAGTSLPSDLSYFQLNGWSGTAGSTAAHVAFYTDQQLPDADIEAHAAAGLTGFDGDYAGARIQRYATIAGIPTAEVDLETGSTTCPLGVVDPSGNTPLDLMRQVEATEGGVLFDAPDNTLTYHDRTHRYGDTTNTFTLDASAQEIEAGLAPKLDRSSMLNDVTATLADGTAAPVRVHNQASIDAYGPAREDLELVTTNPIELPGAAGWRVNRYAEPRPRIPNLAVNLLPLSTARQALLLAATIGTRFGTTNLPSQAASSTADYFVEGYTELIGLESYELSFNVSPAELWDVFILDTDLLDSAALLGY